MIGTYTIRHPTGVFYIGQTKDFEQRQYEHVKSLRGGYHRNAKLQEAFNTDPRLDWSFDPTTDVGEAQALEDYYIAINKGDPKLANMHGNNYRTALIDMCTGSKQSEETIQRRISKTKGMKRSEVFKENQSLAHKSNPNVQANMVQLHERAKRSVTVAGVKYPSVKAAAAAHDISSSTVLQRINSGNFNEWSY